MWTKRSHNCMKLTWKLPFQLYFLGPGCQQGDINEPLKVRITVSLPAIQLKLTCSISLWNLNIKQLLELPFSQGRLKPPGKRMTIFIQATDLYDHEVMSYQDNWLPALFLSFLTFDLKKKKSFSRSSSNRNDEIYQI